MKTNDLKKGTRVLLAYGDKGGDLAGCRDLARALRYERDGLYHPWQGVIADNKRGTVRMCMVYGFEAEMGSVYAHDMLAYEEDGKWLPIEHTPEQERVRKMVDRLFEGI